MRRVASEVREPGMLSSRRCGDCGGKLEDDDDVRCIECRPRLSEAARAAEVERLLLVEADRQIAHAFSLLKRVSRTIERKKR